MEPVAGGLAHLESYGALGIVAAALLGLVVLLIRQFVNHAIKSNEQLQAQNVEMQKENLKAMHAMVTEMTKLRTDIAHEIRIGIAALANERDREVTGRHRVPTRTPRSSG